MRSRRLLAVIVGGLALVVCVSAILQPWFPGCLFHRMTGLHCPGCGMTRAIDSVLHGRIAEGFRFHALGLLLLGLSALFLTIRIPVWLRGASDPGFPAITGSTGAWIAGGLLVFWVLRNVPYWPYTLLAPP